MLVVIGCLLLSHTVFDQFGFSDDGPEAAVDSGTESAHRRRVDTHAVVASLAPLGPDSTSDSLPRHRDELLDATVARWRRSPRSSRFGTTFSPVRPVVPIQHHRS